MYYNSLSSVGSNHSCCFLFLPLRKVTHYSSSYINESPPLPCSTTEGAPGEVVVKLAKLHNTMLCVACIALSSVITYPKTMRAPTVK